ncbi:hypothetical protein RIF29_31669 [Crotalaria pallida]|uniref:poly(A)-specific ribonuclease n=1 Tax=Crotalaria pallida TaxID=3830 RepID=A0AAN9EMP7_CROPI
MEEPNILIRKVYAESLDSEFILIRQLLPRYRFVSMDTEFPGVIHHVNPTKPHQHHHLKPYEHYGLLKRNVDDLKLIQVGLTLADAFGNLPVLDGFRCIWEFNFCDFDVTRDDHAPDSIALLREQGIGFEQNKERGADSSRFARLMMWSGMINNPLVTWVTFHGGYDIAYLVKILTQRKLPENLDGFLEHVRMLFGERLYDVKYMIRFCDSLYGGLERVAKALSVDRVAGKCHQASSDSLLTWHVFEKIASLVKGGHRKYAGVLFGLEPEVRPPPRFVGYADYRLCPRRNFNYVVNWHGQIIGQVLS